MWYITKKAVILKYYYRQSGLPHTQYYTFVGLLRKYTSVSWLRTTTVWGYTTPCPITLASPGLLSTQLKPFITGIGGIGAWTETET